MKRFLLALLSISLVSCGGEYTGAQLSLRINGVPVFMSHRINEVKVMGDHFLVELNKEDSANLKRYLDEYFSKGGHLDVYFGENLYKEDLYVQSNYSVDWKNIKLRWTDGSGEFFEKNNIKVIQYESID